METITIQEYNNRLILKAMAIKKTGTFRGKSNKLGGKKNKSKKK